MISAAEPLSTCPLCYCAQACAVHTKDHPESFPSRLGFGVPDVKGQRINISGDASTCSNFPSSIHTSVLATVSGTVNMCLNNVLDTTCCQLKQNNDLRFSFAVASCECLRFSSLTSLRLSQYLGSPPNASSIWAMPTLMSTIVEMQVNPFHLLLVGIFTLISDIS